MKKHFKPDNFSYKNTLINHDFEIAEVHNYLQWGVHDADLKPALYISVITIQIFDLLELLLPIIKNTNTPFSLIKDCKVHYMLNAGDYGLDEIGKVIVLYTKDAHDTVQLATDINLVTEEFNGPLCCSARRIGKILYLEESGITKGIQIPNLKRYHIKKRRLIFSKCYIPIAIIKNSFKGTAYKAVSMQRLSFKSCLIKEGNPFALDDQFGRNIRDRLLWQKEVTLDLQDQVATPSFYDYFEEYEYSYLVIQYVEGITLFKAVRDIYNTKKWNHISNQQQNKLLGYFLDAVGIVQIIHQKGYVQRDISDSNFLVMSNGELCIIDFELSYHMTRKEPANPFPLGTVGYAAPEQLKLASPDYKEDVYALGALLCFILTGIPPGHFICEDRKKLSANLQRIINDRSLTRMILSCLSVRRSDRPDLVMIKEAVSKFISEKY